METPEVMIEVNNVAKEFKLPHEKSGSIKSLLVNFRTRKRTFEQQKALEKITFQVNRGEFFGIIGRNGSGKSTLLKILAGIYTPTRGDIQVNGHLTPFIELGVGFNPELTGRENVFLNGALLGFSRKEMRAMYQKIVDFAEIERFMDQKLKNYSSGMQVRLAFSIAIQAKSDILLIDEVLAVGDQAFQEKCYRVFEDIKREGRTVVFISHDGGAIERFCDRVAIVDQGKLINIGNPRDMVLEYGAIVAEDQHHRREAAADSTGKERQGNGAIRSGKITVSGKSGKTAASLREGEPFTVNIPYKVHRAVDESIVIGVGILDENGVSILGPNTQEENMKVSLSNRSGHIKVHFPYNPLAPRTYSVTVGFFNETSTLAYDLVTNATQFKVIGKGRHGQAHVAPDWEIK